VNDEGDLASSTTSSRARDPRPSRVDPIHDEEMVPVVHHDKERPSVEA
jgi:hypothetical protein